MRQAVAYQALANYDLTVIRIMINCVSAVSALVTQALLANRTTTHVVPIVGSHVHILKYVPPVRAWSCI